MSTQAEKYAELYLQRGWSVIPVRVRTKLPLVEWKEFTVRRPTLEEVSGWFKRWPDCGIGIVTGPVSNLAIVDADGFEGIREAGRQHLDSPFISITGKGKQFLFGYPKEGIKNSVKKWPGLDIRGENGFVVAPPSIHPLGKCYIWEKFFPYMSLPDLPKMFTEEPRASGTTSTLRKQSDWIADALEDMRKGHVHNTLVSVLGKFRSHNFSEEDTYRLLQPHALLDGKPYEGLRVKITEIWRRYQAGTMPQTHAKAEDIDVFLADVKEKEWICKPYFARKSVGLIAGLPETMKTWLCVDLAVESARKNGLWLGLFPITSCRTLFMDQERSKEETQDRFRAVLAAKGIGRVDLKGRLYLRSETTVRLNIDSSYQAFRAELQSMQPDLVIVDSLKTFHTAPENDSTEMQKVFDRLKELRNEIGCTFVIIHHENKNAYPNGEPQGEPHMGTLSGSGVIGAAPEFCLIVRKVEEDTSMVWHAKSTQGKKAKPFYASVTDVADGILVSGLNA